MRKAGLRAAALLTAGSLALAGCASDDSDSDSSGSGSSGGGDGDVKIGLAYDTGGRGDKSFNDSAYAGASAAAESLGAELQDLSPNADASNRADLLTQLADDGFNPIIAVGFAYADALAEVAPQYPDVSFAIVDSAVDGTGLDNATGLLFAAEQGSFLGGVAAALKTETDHIGFVGGVDVPLIQTFQAGYEQGARAVNPDIVIDVQYISPAGDFSGFNAPEKATDIAGAMYANGADIVYHAAGGSGQGVFEAAAAAGGLAIGVDSDQYETVGDAALQQVILTSVLKRVDVAVQSFIEDFESGDVEGGTDIVNDLSTEGMELSTSGGFIDDIQAQIDDYRQQIIDGDIEVSSTP
ncbi:BMP family protein [Blastococcus sp. URHD0036]|uniref:BMP family lipoprotein n=1 Tax=Blastococcus sp. URHD0036 TaxID=1380356 RepID=UPI0004970647|nr:BMP family ABC transporter substrate-binding protein [Blastococcus sp. URHD0036]